jgi:hypothetical protein
LAKCRKKVAKRQKNPALPEKIPYRAKGENLKICLIGHEVKHVDTT